MMIDKIVRNCKELKFLMDYIHAYAGSYEILNDKKTSQILHDLEKPIERAALDVYKYGFNCGVLAVEDEDDLK